MSNEDISKKLGTHFPETAIKSRQGGGGRSFRYIEGHAVIHRLNEATGNNWSLDIKEITNLQIGDKTLLQARVALTIPGLGTREHIGVQAIDARGGEDLVKGVVTDALKKAATLFGVGLELYGPDYEAGEIAPATTRQPQPQRANAPVKPQEPRRDAQSPEPASQGQKNVIAKHAKERGLSDRDIHAILTHQGIDGVDALDRDRAIKFIGFLQDAGKVSAYRATMGAAQQTEMIPTDDPAAKARS